MRKIAVITTSRADFGIYLPLLKKIQQDSEVDLRLIVGGSHLSEVHGRTIDDIIAHGFDIDERVKCVPCKESSKAVAVVIGEAVSSFAKAYFRISPDIIVVLGDRFEMHSAAIAALPMLIPVAHLYGGELTEGAIDDAFRHSMTKLSHLHFVATEEYARRVIQLGEAPWRVTVSGAMSLDNINEIKLLTTEEIKQRINFNFSEPPILVTYHPVTLERESIETQLDELFAALELSGKPIIFSLPNADLGGEAIAREFRIYTSTHKNSCMADNLGTQLYFSLMANSAVMIGNSSSGIIEAQSFRLPVVNIGNRQKGRVRAENVIDVECKTTEIAVGIEKAYDLDFKSNISGKNPYNNHGNASQVILDGLKKVKINETLIKKQFYDLPYAK